MGTVTGSPQQRPASDETGCPAARRLRPCPKPKEDPKRAGLGSRPLSLGPPLPCSTPPALGWPLTPNPAALSLQRSPTRSTPSPAPPPTARPSPTTWTSPTRHAPTCSTSWRSTPQSPPSTSSCARWPPRRARARWACPRCPSTQSASPPARPSPKLPGPLGRSPSYPCLCPQELYLRWVLEARRHILAILQDYPSLRPPIDHLCELLPRLQARYYSIASSSKVGAPGPPP